MIERGRAGIRTKSLTNFNVTNLKRMQGTKRFPENNALVWCPLKVPTLLAVAMDPLNTLERLNIALDEEKQGHM